MATPKERRTSDRFAAHTLGVTTATLRASRRKQTAPFSYVDDGAIEVIDATNICRDDRCDRIEIHATHPVDRRATDPFCDPTYHTRKVQRHGPTLNAIVAKHIERRRCKVFREIYNDVIHDYGTFKSKAAGTRAIWRAIEQLLAADQITSIKVAGTKSPGGYVRSDSPLLRDSDGRRSLLESLEDQFPTW
jgi:hypothetical protein